MSFGYRYRQIEMMRRVLLAVAGASGKHVVHRS
jgi:hypothetical protein